MTKAPMSTMPPVIDRVAWIVNKPEEYMLVARHFAEQTAYWSTFNKRKPMHRAGSTYWRDTIRGWKYDRAAYEKASTKDT